MSSSGYVSLLLRNPMFAGRIQVLGTSQQVVPPLQIDAANASTLQAYLIVTFCARLTGTASRAMTSHDLHRKVIEQPYLLSALRPGAHGFALASLPRSRSITGMVCRPSACFLCPSIRMLKLRSVIMGLNDESSAREQRIYRRESGSQIIPGPSRSTVKNALIAITWSDSR
ncbi:uncharacterized protein CLUP02_08236 [Colletotrichum lupini]|uniref:Uncharacterized protein n=1 Tax=Colletotrichum lupini TaxID=145971 RepID=A0A9Q8WGU3_9PEZI|nr:uncharacterized protein CLUP02_08236 [Colletotrichum lupini]UQC82746.1 hypothetical protein CLUP02_08236 [Colletotrichum lupini]